MKKHVICCIILFACAVFSGFSALAAGTPDPSVNPVLRSIQEMGAKFYYLGNKGGIDGWLVAKAGQNQAAYATPDNQNAIVGVLFGEKGENITAVQVAALVQSNKEVADLITASSKTIVTAHDQEANHTTSAPSEPLLPTTNIPPGERLVRDLSSAATVVVSAATVVVGIVASPEILMVMDPDCPHCRETWQAMREDVLRGTVHLRFIPIGDKDSENERAGAILLGASDPLKSWETFVGGDRSALGGTPSAAALAAMRANHALIDKWNIQNTPYLVYRARNGKVKIVQGTPSKLYALLGDVGR